MFQNQNQHWIDTWTASEDGNTYFHHKKKRKILAKNLKRLERIPSTIIFFIRRKERPCRPDRTLRGAVVEGSRENGAVFWRGPQRKYGQIVIYASINLQLYWTTFKIYLIYIVLKRVERKKARLHCIILLAPYNFCSLMQFPVGLRVTMSVIDKFDFVFLQYMKGNNLFYARWNIN